MKYIKYSVLMLLVFSLIAYSSNIGFINNGLVIQLTTITDADTPFALADEAYLVIDTANSVITVNLPVAATVIGRIYWIKNSGGVGNRATIDASGSELIDDVLIITLIDKEAITIVSDGSNWHVM